MMFRIVQYLFFIIAFATLVFLILFIYGTVFNKDYDLQALYIITFLVTSVFVVWSIYENNLLRKAQSAFNRKDYKTAFEITEKLAKKDHRQAQFNLSLMYRDGIGTRKNEQQFWHWLEQSAISYADAQLLYAHAYFQNNPFSVATLEVVRHYLNEFVKNKNHPRQPQALEWLSSIEQMLEIERKK